MEFNIAIVDDDLSDIARLKNFIQNWFVLSEHKLNVIRTYTSGEKILKDFFPGMFNIVFMDIIMNDINGIETARALREHDTELLIVFMTTSREYAFDAFPVHPFDYVLKPYGQKDVGRVLDEIMRTLSAEEPKIKIKSAHSEYIIPMGMISSVVSNGHHVEVNISDGRSILSNMTFKEAEKIFSEDSRFLSCNRGIILNMSHISSEDNGVFIMKTGERYPIRVNGQSKIKAAFFQYLIFNMKNPNGE